MLINIVSSYNFYVITPDSIKTINIVQRDRSKYYIHGLISPYRGQLWILTQFVGSLLNLLQFVVLLIMTEPVAHTNGNHNGYEHQSDCGEC